MKTKILIILGGLFLMTVFLPLSEALAAAPSITAISPASASIGATVTLTGANFGTRRGTVNFGSAAATTSLWSNKSIRATVPSGTGAVSVTVRTAAYQGNHAQTSNGIPFTFAKVPATSGYSNFKVLANNDLGMHCVDKDFSVFSILPPYNVVNAQVVGQNSSGRPTVLDNSKVFLRYSPIADASGSINSRSIGKTNFWTYAFPLFGANLSPGQGLKGWYMPADAQNSGQIQFGWNSGLGVFSAEGVPIVPVDDAGKSNKYPLIRITAHDKTTGAVLSSTDTVLPVSDETDCSVCHATGKVAARAAGLTWAVDPDVDAQSRNNILILHDKREGTKLAASKPVLCASCHYSPALDLAGTGPVGAQVGKPLMSAVMHDYHADKIQNGSGKTVYDAAAPILGVGVPPADQQACYQCHPGSNTKCLRGAMTDAVTCQNCHGGMKAVGGQVAMKIYGPIDGRTTDFKRHPWADEPRCQSCHTGDALNHIVPGAAGIDNQLASDGIRLMKAFDARDPAASPLLAGASMGGTKRFAEDDGKLFRHSKGNVNGSPLSGHKGLACESCHGSTHAIWPGTSSITPNDDVAAASLQGHAGTIIECGTCHKNDLGITMGGPHGMHPVGSSRFVNGGHEDYAESHLSECMACHGASLKGTVLSKAQVTRTLSAEERTVTIAKGQKVACDICHEMPGR